MRLENRSTETTWKGTKGRAPAPGRRRGGAVARRGRPGWKPWFSGLLLTGALLLGGAGTGWAKDDRGDTQPSSPTPSSLKRARHLEFDERLIMGQSLKSGALYLFERKDSEIQSMLKIRKDYRRELLAPLEPPP